MLETSARLLRLLSLLQVHRDWSGADLADRLGVTPRTVRRDVDKLRSLGYPVHASTGTAGGYRLGAGAALPPLLLDDEEAVAVAIGLRSAASGSVEGIAEASVRALAKIDQVLPSRLRRRVEALRAATVTVDSRAAKVSADTLALLAAAYRDRERVRFDYTARAGQDSLREVEPYRLVQTGRRWYLVAYDIGRADWRTFRVDRMRPRTPTGPRFAPREEPAQDTAAWTARRLAVEQYPYRARITMRAPAHAVADRIPPEYGLVEPLDADSCVLTVGGDRLETMALYVAMVGVEFEVHEPPELIAQVRATAARMARAAGDGGGAGDTSRDTAADTAGGAPPAPGPVASAEG
ncbi:MAG TPA: YafY family protein [Actinocrinis sp.]|nr:YafY family protein [Actinocrinis sp.]